MKRSPRSWPIEAPRLTFFCELPPKPLTELFADPELIPRLQALAAGISLGIMDFSPERTAVVRRLNEAQVPVVAWHLLPLEQGYWYHADNSAAALAYYHDLRRWTQAEGLRWDGMGLDLEPDISEFQRLVHNKLGVPWRLLRRCASSRCLAEARAAFGTLIDLIHQDGYRCDSYEFPFLLDERRAGSQLIQRLLRMIDLPADRRITMLYTSLFRPHGVGVLWSYARDAQAVGVGLTGGGVELDGWRPAPLTWTEFARDLRLARRGCGDIHIFSLEGCVRQGFLEPLGAFDWSGPAAPPRAWGLLAGGVRRLLRGSLWLAARLGLGPRPLSG